VCVWGGGEGGAAQHIMWLVRSHIDTRHSCVHGLQWGQHTTHPVVGAQPHQYKPLMQSTARPLTPDNHSNCSQPCPAPPRLHSQSALLIVDTSCRCPPPPNQSPPPLRQHPPCPPPPLPTWLRRCRPSKVKGMVTMPTVRMPMARAVAATTGAAPLPVPPPMPACSSSSNR
jgi:hypothetical protein